MDDKFLYKNYPFWRLQLVDKTFGHDQLLEPTNQNSKVPESSWANEKLSKRNYKTLLTSVINSPISPPSLINLSVSLCETYCLFYTVSNNQGREGTLDCKLNWCPKFYKCVILSIECTIGSFINFFIVCQFISQLLKQ